jgi:hypothetical protein
MTKTSYARSPGYSDAIIVVGESHLLCIGSMHATKRETIAVSRVRRFADSSEGCTHRRVGARVA